MIKRGTKVAFIVVIIILVIIGISIPIYFNFTNKSAYHVTDVEVTEYTAADFADKSELKLFQNGTFHVRIEHKTKGLSLIGIGTYSTDDKTYQLNFTSAYARDNVGHIIDYTTECNTKVTCSRSGSRIKFTDHKYQTFYFG